MSTRRLTIAFGIAATLAVLSVAPLAAQEEGREAGREAGRAVARDAARNATLAARSALLPGLAPAVTPPRKDARWRRVGPELIALGERAAGIVTTPAAPLLPQPFARAPGEEPRVAIDAVADGDPTVLADTLAGLGAGDIAVFGRIVSARLPLAAIEPLAGVGSLRFARPAAAAVNVGATTSQADAALRTDVARLALGLDGAGITVGLLSDSFDCGGATPGDYAADRASGDLPGGVEVLADIPCGSDEGRAMAQLVHDLAPGSGLSYHTAFGGMADFALGIEELAGCPAGSEPGCVPAAQPARIIVDDVGYLTSPMFQDGVVAQAVDVVHDAGVAYFSSAGNAGRASYEGTFDSSGFSPPGYPFPPGDAHDFDPGPGVDVFQKVTLAPGTTRLSLQWDQPFFSVSGPPGSANDLDLCLYPEPTTDASPFFCMTAASVGADPVELLGVTAVRPVTVNLAIVRNVAAGGPSPGRIKYVAFDSDFAIVDPHGVTAGGTLFGHANARGAIATGAADYRDTPVFGTDPARLEAFSSAGGTPILFAADGTPLDFPPLRMRPQIVAPDGANTTFFGSDTDGDGFPNFFGTSAAAPHAAATAALLRSAFPGLTPAGVESVLVSSARGQDMGVAGFDFDSGHGLVDGEAALRSVHPGAACDGVAELILEGAPGGGGTFGATGSIRYAGGALAQIVARAPVHVFENGASVAGGSVFGHCPHRS